MTVSCEQSRLIESWFLYTNSSVRENAAPDLLSTSDSKLTPQHTKTHYTGFAAQVQMDLISSRHTSPKLSPQSTKEPITTWDTEHKHLARFQHSDNMFHLKQILKTQCCPTQKEKWPIKYTTLLHLQVGSQANCTYRQPKLC